MADSDTVTAALLIIGNEILSGRTKDANLPFIAEGLGGMGIRLSEVRVVPDIEDEIIAAVNLLREKYDYLFTTGGIGPKNVADWLAHSAVTACGGSWLVKKDLLAAGDWETVERLTREATELAAG